MPEIAFVQYKRPNGFQVDVSIDRPDNVFAKATQITQAAFRLECEELSTGDCSFTISDGDQDYAISVVPNDDNVPTAVDKLILDFDIAAAIAQRGVAAVERKKARDKARAEARAEAAKNQL